MTAFWLQYKFPRKNTTKSDEAENWPILLQNQHASVCLVYKFGEGGVFVVIPNRIGINKITLLKETKKKLLSLDVKLV